MRRACIIALRGRRLLRLVREGPAGHAGLLTKVDKRSTYGPYTGLLRRPLWARLYPLFLPLVKYHPGLHLSRGRSHDMLLHLPQVPVLPGQSREKYNSGRHGMGKEEEEVIFDPPWDWEKVEG